jgi:hypothetical protein
MITREIFSVLLAIVGLAVIATLVSRNANTAGVTNSVSSFFNSAIATAQGPVSGYSPGPPIYQTATLGGSVLGITALGGA